MVRHVPLSSKLDLIARDGYALAASRQPGYTFNWHAHDCAMLLWPRAGALDSAWDMAGGRRRGRLVRGQALLLPAYVSHSTRSGSATHQHGELYLAPELMRRCLPGVLAYGDGGRRDAGPGGSRRASGQSGGALQLDGAAQAILEALWMPALSSRAMPGLVCALIEQLGASRPAAIAPEPVGHVARRWLHGLQAGLEHGRPLPSIAQSAATLGVSVRTLQRACMQEYGCAPVTLRRMALAEAARARMAAGEPLARVSVELGFANSGHLGRLLREAPASLPFVSRMPRDG
ncbi:HTH araC/xylS-type domain-containing protein [Bordetella sputigena]|uniref:helix-turn-helix domain-containing protein n=1 Tax=Bordetella sputigena TaxID=1416810 RepID=UPI0039F1267A